ncbi:Autotransporter translocation and assembly factor TamB [Pseudidiomarina indica]|uniref:Autotransporter translocation and assembly factor TamB n=1 Tax=Pseudidiomarina indica TaxID=1159017 RepID=A0A1G6E1S0_9GAMM|nr:translocation/assembly module TamB domain-containing protein [Pseudidiomarina indica]SDB51399.1 Autotransporter translocation and assembly factor TamB [Pseudidiomarina indica]
MRIVKYLAWLVVITFVVIPTLVMSVLMTTSGTRWVLEQTAKIAEIELQFEQLEGNLLGELHLRGVVVGQPQWQLTFDSLLLDWSPSELLDGRLVFNTIVTERLNVTLSSAEDAASEPQSSIELPTLKLPLTLELVSFTARNNRLTIDGQDHDLPSIDLTLTWQESNVHIEHLDVIYSPLFAKLSGQLETTADYPLDLNLDWQLTQPVQQIEIQQISGQSRLQGSVDEFQLANLFYVAESTQQHQALVRVRNLLSGSPDWLAQVEIVQFPLAPLIPIINLDTPAWSEWLKTTQLTVNAQVDPQQAVLTQLVVEHIGQQDGVITGHGVLSNYLEAVEQPEAVTFQGELQATAIALPEPAMEQPVLIKEVTAQVNGSIAHYEHDLTANVNWLGEQPLQLHLTGQGTQTTLNTELLLTSDVLSAQMTADLSWQDDLRLQAAIHQLQAPIGQFTGQQLDQLHAQGMLGFEKNRLTASHLTIGADDNQLRLNGAMTDAEPLLLELQLPELALLHQHDYVAGQASASLAITGDIFEQLIINIHSFELDHPDFGRWQQAKTGSIQLPIAQPLATSMHDVCFKQQDVRIPAELCLMTEATQAQQHTQLLGNNLPLALLNRFRDSNVAERIWGLATLNSSFIYNTSTWEIEKLEGELRSDNTVLFALDEEISTRFDYWQVNWNGDLNHIEASLTAELEQSKGMIIGDIALQPFDEMGELDGEILMNLKDLTVLQWVLPDLRYEDAHALAEINISGTNQQPMIEGSVELAAREIGFSQSGLLLSDVRIAAFDTPDNENSITLDGQALSGDGWISIKGLIEPLKPELLIRIEGDKFRAIQVPTVTVDISPKLTISLKNSRIDVQGEVTVPLAHIDQPEISESGVSASNDVVVLKNGEPFREQRSLSHYPVYADVRVNLGQDISVSGYGFEGGLKGSLRLIETPTRSLTASGNVSVHNGHYEIYGQRLEIVRGSLIYNGGPVDNPGLDLRVERASENILSTEDVQVGAQVSGTLHEPSFRLYSMPAMPDSEVLSYLILGRGSGAQFGSGDNLQLQALILLGSKGTEYLGQSLQSTFGFDEFGIDSTMNPNDTSFYIGKYLSPKLYVKYGVGLFEDTNTFLIRYLLSDRLIIESTTSTEAQGGDIFYTIEK